MTFQYEYTNQKGSVNIFFLLCHYSDVALEPFCFLLRKHKIGFCQLQFYIAHKQGVTLELKQLGHELVLQWDAGPAGQRINPLSYHTSLHIFSNSFLKYHKVNI